MDDHRPMVFLDKFRPDGKQDILFNRPEIDGSNHGHVVQSRDQLGNLIYHYVRDWQGDIYIDDRRK